MPKKSRLGSEWTGKQVAETISSFFSLIFAPTQQYYVLHARIIYHLYVHSMHTYAFLIYESLSLKLEQDDSFLSINVNSFFIFQLAMLLICLITQIIPQIKKHQAGALGFNRNVVYF
jgi:hypothetical protein